MKIQSWLQETGRRLFWGTVNSPMARSARKWLHFLTLRYPAYYVTAHGAFFRPDFSTQSYLFQLADGMGLTGIYKRVRPWNLPSGVKKILPLKVRGMNDFCRPDSLLPEYALRLVKEKGFSLLFDLSGEGVCYHPVAETNLRAFHDKLEKLGIPGECVFLLNTNAKAAESYAAWADEKGITYRIRPLGYNYYLLKMGHELARAPWIKGKEADYAAIAKRALAGEKRSKHFMSLNHKARPHRTALLLFLIEQNALAKGIITYFGEEKGIHAGRETTLRQLQELAPPHLMKHVEKLQQLSPIEFERKASEIGNVYKLPPWTIDYLLPEAWGKGRVDAFDSYFEIVSETYFTDARDFYITEKIIRPIMRFQPFIHMGSPRVMAYMKSIGFKTFSPLIDDAYDTMDNPKERMQAILQQVGRLAAMSLDELHAEYCKLWPVLEHNYTHLLKVMPAVYARELPEILAGFDSGKFDLASGAGKHYSSAA